MPCCSPAPPCLRQDHATIQFDARYLNLPLRRDEAALQQMLQHALPLTVLQYRRDRLLVQRVRQTLATQPSRPTAPRPWPRCCASRRAPCTANSRKRAPRCRRSRTRCDRRVRTNCCCAPSAPSNRWPRRRVSERKELYPCLQGLDRTVTRRIPTPGRRRTRVSGPLTVPAHRPCGETPGSHPPAAGQHPLPVADCRPTRSRRPPRPP